jgi:uncharacterized protein YoxC
MMPSNLFTVLVIFSAISAVGVFLQAGVLLGMFLAGRKAARQFEQLSEQIRMHALPALSTARSLIEDVSPKVKVAASDLVEVSHTVRSQVNAINATISDVNHKARVHAERVDEMVNGTLNNISSVVDNLGHAVAAPVRQVSGVVNGVRAGIDTLRKSERQAPARDDKDIFI